MYSPTFSIIIPAYMAADFIAEAIQSVLNQTFGDFELIVVNDASPDKTTMVVKSFSDFRIKYIVHEQNKGLPATRNTGIRASAGKYIAFLDHDDVFFPEKLETHYKYLEEHPDIGTTYNSRFEIAQSINIIKSLWIAPENVILADFVLGYPFSPSDIVIRREWLFHIGLLDEDNLFHGEDLNTNCRLALSGCRFANVNRVLNYRRNHPSRVRKNLDASLKNVFRNLDVVFNDPRCPQEVIRLRDLAFATNYLVWSFWALAQDDIELGQEYLRCAIRLDDDISRNGARKLLDFIVWNSLGDDRGDLAATISKVILHLPEEISFASNIYNWTISRGYLIKAFYDVLWGRHDDGNENFLRAFALHAKVDESILNLFTHQLLGYENVFGGVAAYKAIGNLCPHLNHITTHSGSKLMGSYLINQAFKNYRDGDYKHVPNRVLRSWWYDTSYLVNRGVLSIFLRSIIKAVR